MSECHTLFQIEPVLDPVSECSGIHGFRNVDIECGVTPSKNVPERCRRGAAQPRVEAAKQAGTLGVDADMIKP
jgi:hypothetical protein